MRENNRMKKHAVILPILAMFFVFLLPVVLAAVDTGTDTATVDVTVANKTMIDISPNAYIISGVEPGTVSIANTSFELENIGSKPLDKIDADIIGLPTSNPYGTGVTANYAAGNYLALYADNTTNGDGTLSTNVNDFWFVHTRNFNQSSDRPRYVTLMSPDDNFDGRIRIDNEEFFFQVQKDASGYWGNGTLIIGDTPHNKTSLGDVDLSDNTGITLTKSDVDPANVGYADVTLNIDGAAKTYCAIVNATGGYVDLVQWSTSLDEGKCTNDFDILDPSAPDLQPGQTKAINLGVRLAYGVMQGSLTQSTLEIIATSAY